MDDGAAQALGEEARGEAAMAARGVGAAAQEHDRAADEQRGNRAEGALRVGEYGRAVGEGIAVAEGGQMRVDWPKQLGKRLLASLGRLRGRCDPHVDQRGRKAQHLVA